jgi:hypothetical protein
MARSYLAPQPKRFGTDFPSRRLRAADGRMFSTTSFSWGDSMKAAVKFAIAGLALVGSGSAFADIALPNAGNGDVFLMIRDLSNTSRVALLDLNIGIQSVLSESAIQATPGSSTTLRNGTPISFSFSLPTITDPRVTSFLSVASSKGYEWGLFAGDTVGSTSTSDPYRYLQTAAIQYSSTTLSALTNSTIGEGVGAASAGIDAYLPSANQLLVNDWGVDGSFGAPGGPVDAFNSAGPIVQDPNDSSVHALVAVGQAANLYVWASSVGAQSGGTAGNSGSRARVYQALDVVLDANGSLHSVGGDTVVPVPAAIWLLGSGLAGLGVFGRRRKLTA